VAKVVSPFKTLLFSTVLGTIAGAILSVFGDKSPEILWIFTAVLGLAYSPTTAGMFYWVAHHLPSKQFIK